MKRIILSLVTLMVFNIFAYSQNAAIDKIFNKYALKDGFVTVNISSKMFNLFVEEEEKLDDAIIGNIKILTVEDSTLNGGLNFYNDIIPKLNLDDYNELLHVNTSDEKVVFMNKKRNKGKQEFLMVVGGDDNAIIYVEGTLRLSDAGKISRAMNSNEFKIKAGSK